MSRIFLSHSSQDNDQARMLSEWLKDRNQRSLFLDFDPADGIPAGHEWEKELYRQLRQCQAVIVLISEHSVASHWCFSEVTFAKALGKHLFPVRLDASPVWPILADLQVVDLSQNPEAGLERLWRAMLLKGLDPKSIFDWDGTRPPYPGLPAFSEADAAIFFGRDEEIHQVIAELNLSRQLADTNLIILEGISGSGKSSLLRAGVIPRLKKDIDNWLIVEPIRPLQNPGDELSAALRRAFPDSCPDTSLIERFETLLQRIRKGEPGDTLLGDAAQCLRQARDQGKASVVMIIDQFEELFSPEHLATSQGFMELLAANLLAEDCGFLLVATMRADYRSELEMHAVMGKVPFKAVPVLPMNIESFEEVIRGPAQLDGLELESGLVHAILSDIKSRSALPLLAFTLRELWDRYGEDRKLTLDEYRDKLGGLQNSVAQVAEALLQAHDPSREQLAAIRSAFVCLARINDEGKFVRQAVSWENLPEQSLPVIEEFVRKHLLVSRVDERSGQRVTEVAHEALFSAWSRLRKWLEAERSYLEWKQRLQADIHDWQQIGKDRSALLRGATLNEALVWYGRKKSELDPGEARFIERSRKDRNRVRTLFTSLGLATTSVILVFAIVALIQRNLANDARDEATERLVINYWMNGIDARDDQRNTLLASHYFVRAAQSSGLENTPAFTSALFAARFLSGNLALDRILEPGDPAPAWLKPAAACPSGSLSASYEDGEISLPANQGSIAHPLVRCAIFNPVQGQILSWGDDHSARIWTADGSPIRTVRHGGNVRGAIFSRDGSAILTWSDDGTAMLWDSINGYRLSLPMRHDGSVSGAMFSPDETGIATWQSSPEDGARIWRFQKAPPLTRLLSKAAAADRFGSSPVQAGCSFREQRVLITDLARWPAPREFPGQATITGCDYHASSGSLLVRDSKFVVQVQDLVDSQARLRLQLDRRLNGAAFTPDGDGILVWFDDGRVAVRDIDSGEETGRFNNGSVVKGARLTPSGDKLVTWDRAGVIRIRDARHFGQLAYPMTHNEVDQVWFSADERILVSKNTFRLRLWDARLGYPLTPSLPHASPIRAVSFDPDGRMLKAELSDSVRIWRLPVNEASAGHDPVTAQEQLTGTRLMAETGKLQVLEKKEWTGLSGDGAPATVGSLVPDEH